jgi:hypothetical protein
VRSETSIFSYGLRVIPLARAFNFSVSSVGIFTSSLCTCGRRSRRPLLL